MSVSKLSRRRGEILDEIMRYHRRQLPAIMRDVPEADVRALASVAPPPADFIGAMKMPGVSLIAECKRASPSKGLLVPEYDPVSLARDYVRAGAAAISVLTDGRHFQGSLADLRDVKEGLMAKERTGNVPVLRKDFVFHPYHCYEARAAGADGLLLIASVLAKSELSDLMALATELGMIPLIEVHTESELEEVLSLGPSLIGVNNRNLQTFEVDFDNTARLRRMIPPDVLVVAESGIRTREHVVELAAVGVDAILVGEALVTADDTYEATRQLVEAGSPG